jgi:WS/DGAT/MGAT family acyltransferase
MDAFFLYWETPSQHMHVTLTAVLDPATVPEGREPFTFARFRDHVASRLHLIPPFTRRLVPVPLRLHHPLWVEDPDLDLDQHLRRAALPSPGDDRQLAELTAQIASLPLDRSRPLWEMWVVEGLEGGRVAFVAKVHHSGLDGVAGVEQLVKLFDLEVDAAPVEPPPAWTRVPEPLPTDAELLTYAAVSRARGLMEVAPLLRRTAGSVFAVRGNRTRQPGAASGGTPLVTPRTPLNGAIGPRRTVAFARLPLDEIREVKTVVPGATVNDVVLTVCAGALRRWFTRHGGAPEEPLVAACPVNVRTDDQQGRADNRVSALFTHLHTELPDPLERLAATHRTAAAAKEEHALFDASTLQEWAEIADPNVFSLLSDAYSASGLAERHRPPINLMISNVPGPPFPLYLAGAELVRGYPMGPVIEGVGLNITVMSYRSSIDIGFMAAADLVGDVWRLADAVEPAWTELRKAAGH